MPSFADEVSASLPTRLTLPGEFSLVLDWLEAQGCVHTYNRTPERYCALYPASIGDHGSSHVTIAACDPARVKAWTRNDAANAERLAPIIRTGGDGSHAALWLDDQGRQRFVHMGSGSGSIWMGVICDSPVDMLRLMAIGYDEMCWPDHFEQTPAEAYEGDDFGRGPYLAPLAFRAFVQTTFGVTVPATASEIVKRAPGMNEATSDDPFWRWIRSFASSASGKVGTGLFMRSMTSPE